MIKRPDYLNKLIAFKDYEQIKVITGIRRCGKSSILDMFAQYLRDENVSETNIIQLNFENLKYSNMTYLELNDLIEKQLKQINGKLYVLLDEIQRIDKWELTVNSLRLNKNADIYITGSNAYLLSSQLATYLSGRYVEIKVYPLSFKEFINFYNFSDNITKEEKFNLFFKYGGMPGLKDFNFDEQKINQVLDGIFSSVLTKDVMEQTNIKEFSLLKKIINFLADNIGNQTSINNIKNTLYSQKTITKGTKQETIDNYIACLQNAFVFYKINRYDIKGKEYLKTNGKYYIVDTGLRNCILGFRDIDIGHIIENIVFLELLKKGYAVSVGKTDNGEIDFIATTSKQKIYIQVCESLKDEKTRNRELNPLKNIKDNYEKIILTMDNVFTDTDEEGIKIINLIDWLLDK